MKIQSCILFILFLTVAFSAYSISTEEALNQAVDEFEKAVTKISVAGVGNIVYGSKKIGSSYSLYIQESISSYLQKSSRFELSDRSNLDAVMEEFKLSLSGITEGTTVPEIGMLKGLEYIVTGKFIENSNSVILYLDFVKMDTGVSVSKVKYNIDKSTIPSGISIIPDNYNDAFYVLDTLSDITSGNKEGFEVKAWSIRGEGGIYRNGENLQINFFSNRDCFIKVYHIDVNNKLSLIFPNPYYSDNFVKGEKIYKIPDNKYPFKFTLKAPYGTEIIKVAASTV
jgi:hypothetical protein